MPKRRMTPARKAAIAKWQRAGAKARKAKSSNKTPPTTDQLRKAFAEKMPMGKTVVLYHHTTPEKAAKIMRSGFKPLTGKGIQRARARDGIADVTWFHDRKHHALFETFAGSALLTVRVPRKVVIRRQLGIGDELMVKHKDLAGVKIRRLK